MQRQFHEIAHTLSKTRYKVDEMRVYLLSITVDGSGIEQARRGLFNMCTITYTVAAFLLVKATFASDLERIDTAENNYTSQEIPEYTNNISDAVRSTKLLIKKTCMQEYSSACLKLDLIKIMDKLGSSGPLQIIPGVTLVQKPAQEPLPANLPLQDSPRLDNHLYKRINSYLKSLSLNVQILDPSVLRSLKKFGEGATQFFVPENAVTGRKKNRMNQAFWIAGLLSAGTMLAMGMSTLSAMAGKALMTSLLALMLSAFAALKGHGDDKKSTTYEIITRPIYTHSGHKHAETMADAHMMGSSHGGPTYSYRRSIDFGQPQDNYPLTHIIEPRP